jgi:hypothetical protein
LNRRSSILKVGQECPEIRDELQPQIRQLNRQILTTPVYDFHDDTYRRVRFIRYADDMVIGVIGSKQLARQITEELANWVRDNLKLALNREKTKITHLPTDRAQFLGYEFTTAGPRYRRRNLRQKGSPHNVVQTVKTTSGNITLLVPLRKLSKKLKQYMYNGNPRSMPELTPHSTDQIIEHFNGVICGWYNYYQLAINVSQLNYARYILQYSLAKTLAHKERSTMYKIFRKYGKDLTYIKPNGKPVHFFNQPLKQVKKANASTRNPDLRRDWYPRRTRTRLLDNCAICGSDYKVEMHHLRHIRKRGQHLQGFDLYMAAINRKQIPVCLQCHRDIHRGKYDGRSLKDIVQEIEMNLAGQ